MVLEKIFVLIGQSQTRTAYGRHISCMIGTKYINFVQDLPCIIPTKCQFIEPPSFRGEDFLNFRNKNSSCHFELPLKYIFYLIFGGLRPIEHIQPPSFKTSVFKDCWYHPCLLSVKSHIWPRRTKFTHQWQNMGLNTL